MDKIELNKIKGWDSSNYSGYIFIVAIVELSIQFAFLTLWKSKSKPIENGWTLEVHSLPHPFLFFNYSLLLEVNTNRRITPILIRIQYQFKQKNYTNIN